jgi:hypothetical protein
MRGSDVDGDEDDGDGDDDDLLHTVAGNKHAFSSTRIPWYDHVPTSPAR